MQKGNLEVIIEKYVTRGRTFAILKTEDGFYLAIDYKYIDDEGYTTETLNGFQMCANRNLKKCLKTVRDHAYIDYLLSHGATKAEAFSIVAGVPLEIAEQLF